MVWRRWRHRFLYRKNQSLTENMQELYQTAQDAFEDALLMGCGEAQLRDYLQALVAGLENPYKRG